MALLEPVSHLIVAGGWGTQEPGSPPPSCSSDTAQNLLAPCSSQCYGLLTDPPLLGWQCWASLHSVPAPPCSLALPQNFLYKCVGTALGAASSKDVVRKHLQELLESARYQDEAECEVLAPFLGSTGPAGC